MRVIDRRLSKIIDNGNEHVQRLFASIVRG